MKVFTIIRVETFALRLSDLAKRFGFAGLKMSIHS